MGNVGFQALGRNEIWEDVRSSQLELVRRYCGVGQQREGLLAVLGHCRCQTELGGEPVFVLLVNEDLHLRFSVLETPGAV